MFVFIPGTIQPVRFGPAGTVPSKIPFRPVTYINKYLFWRDFQIKSLCSVGKS